MSLYPPLRASILNPPYRLHRPAPSASPRLRLLGRVSVATGEQLPNLFHANIGGEGRQLGFIDALILGSVVVLVLREFGPHATVDAVAQTGDVGRR